MMDDLPRGWAGIGFEVLNGGVRWSQEWEPIALWVLVMDREGSGERMNVSV